jgi:MoxR-like ATPase
MSLFTKENLNFWLKNNWNILVEGPAGVGKTSLMLECLQDNNINFRYYSCATLDPWVDFIGIPKESVDNNGKHYVSLIPPQAMKDNDVQVIVCDEFNRGHKKVKNALMELIQFKSINGRKFEGLKCIWAAINSS